MIKFTKGLLYRRLGEAMVSVWTHVKLVIVVIIWGFGWPAGRVVADTVPPFTAGWIRYLIAVSCFLIFLKASGNWRTPTKAEWKTLAIIGFFSTFLYQAFFMYGMKYTAAGDASLMITFNPFFTSLLAIVFLSEKMTLRYVFGLILGISGIAVLFIYSPNVDIPFNERLLGDILIAGSALAWACSSILKKKMMTQPAKDAEEPLSPLHLTVWASTIGFGIQTVPFIAEVSQVGISNPSFDAWVGIIFLAVFSTVLSYVWFADGIRTIGAGPASMYVYLVPIFGIFSGWLLLDEKLGLSLLISFVLIVSGLLISQYKHNSENETHSKQES